MDERFKTEVLARALHSVIGNGDIEDFEKQTPEALAEWRRQGEGMRIEIDHLIDYSDRWRMPKEAPISAHHATEEDLIRVSEEESDG